MDSEAFIRWALDDARSVEERYTVELLVELGVGRWNANRRIYHWRTFDETTAINRERTLNPAYQPHYSEDGLRKAVEYLAVATSWSCHEARPVRDLAAVGFMSALEEISLATCCEVVDVSPLTRLPKLRKLELGYPGSESYNQACRDFTPLVRCRALRELKLGFNAHWPDFTGFDALVGLEHFVLGGNLLALPQGIAFPKVRRGALHCMPLAARNVADLPHFPACEFFTLSGVERLEGIERMPALRNLELIGPFESFEPLAALQELTCLTVTVKDHRSPAKMPRDVAPLARLPKLHYLEIGTYVSSLLDIPRDYSPLVEAPALRELVVKHCPPVEMEVSAIQAGLPPCDDLYLGPGPQPLPPLRMCIGPLSKQPSRPDEVRTPGESDLLDDGLRKCEGRWVADFVQRLITEKLGHQDWGEASAHGPSRTLHAEIHSFECVERLPHILDGLREAMTSLRHDYRRADFMIALRVPPPKPTPAQEQLLEKLQDEEDRWEYEQRCRDRAEYLERLHQLELKKQEGAEITPEEFSPEDRAPYPEPPWEKENDDADDPDFSDDDDDEGGEIALGEKPAPPPDIFDDEHPLAGNYRLCGVLTLDEVWFPPHSRDLAIHLMGREPELEFPEEKKVE